MNYNFTKIFIAALSFFYIIIVGLIIRDSFFNSAVVKDISMITTSFFTLIIAILLYDRFNYRKIIFEKKIELVLKLLEKLKATRIHVAYEKKDVKSMYGVLEINKSDISRFQKNKSLNPNAFVIFELQVRNYWKEITDLKNNPYMPKEISKSLDFLDFNSLEIISNNPIYIKENFRLSINNNPENLLSLDKWNKTETDMSFIDFTNGYLNSFNQIEKWIDKHSNFKAELNI
ncbi:hypothetical protein [Flavobacterium sp.]|jgi:hypothetical protein|uniref:hypothetical protein n=1 Tax=Flavobacterium sp. TaxID=239 RepID=UPI0037BFE209